MDVHDIPRPERPHRLTDSRRIRTALINAGEQARYYAANGRREDEDICHLLANEYLDELQVRGEIRPRNEETPCTG